MADRVILDTDAFSFFWQGRPQAASYGRLLRGRVPALTFVTLAEARAGAMLNDWGARRRSNLESSIRRFVTLPFTDELATIWAQLKTDARRNGHPLGQPEHANDLWIASSGVYYGASILTGNRRHFDGLGSVTLIDGS